MDVDAEPFEARFARAVSWRMLTELVLLVGFVALTWWSGVLPRVLGIVFLSALGALVVAAALLARKTADRALVMRLDRYGVTFTGCPPIPWSELLAVEVRPMRPARLLGTPRLVLAFLPRPGVVLPGPPQVGRAPLRWGRGLRQRLYATNLVLPLFAVDVSADEASSAVERVGGIPVRRLPLRRARQLLVTVLLGVAVVVLVVVALSLGYLVG